MALRLAISGRVQGVGYRDSMCAVATRLGVAGWVRNLFDGRVEAHIEGPSEATAALLAWAQHGPPKAHVDQLTVDEYPDEGLEEFQRRATA